jgi:hypothetical protein
MGYDWDSESKMRERLYKHGFEAKRMNGCPLLLGKRGDKLVVVAVRHSQKKGMSEQKWALRWLAEAGIDCFTWNTATKKWSQVKPRKRRQHENNGK